MSNELKRARRGAFVFGRICPWHVTSGRYRAQYPRW